MYSGEGLTVATKKKIKTGGGKGVGGVKRGCEIFFFIFF